MNRLSLTAELLHITRRRTQHRLDVLRTRTRHDRLRTKNKRITVAEVEELGTLLAVRRGIRKLRRPC